MPVGRRFQPGQSGNPGGKAPIIRQIRDLARQHTAEAIEGLHGPGTQTTSGTMLAFTFVNVCDPEQLPNRWPTVIVVTISPAIVKEIGTPCSVVPLHCPA